MRSKNPSSGWKAAATAPLYTGPTGGSPPADRRRRHAASQQLALAVVLSLAAPLAHSDDTPSASPAANPAVPAASPAPAPPGTARAAAAPASASTGAVRGRILAGGEPVAGATVTRAGTFDGAISEADGSFALADLPPGAHVLRVEAPGFGSRTVDVVVRPGLVTPLAVAVAVAVAVGEEIVITGTRAPEKRLDSPVAIETVSDEDILRAGGVSYLAALANLKGIDYAQAGVNDHRISARGFTTQFNARMLTLLDGRLAQLPGSGLPQGNLLPATPLDIKAVEVVVGPASALYGPNAHTGVMNIASKTPWDESGAALLLRGGGQSLMSGSARLAGVAAGRVGWKLNAEYLRASDFEPDRDARVVGADGVARNPHAYGTDGATGGAVPVFEGDLVGDYDLSSLKADGSVYYRAGDVVARGSYGYSRTDGFALSNAGRNHLRGWTVDHQSLELSGAGWFGQVTRTASDAGRSYQLDRLAGLVSAMGGVEALAPAELDALRDSIRFIDRSAMYDGELQHHRRIGPLQATVGLQGRRYRPSSEGTYLDDADRPIEATEVGGYLQLDHRLVPDRLRLVTAARVDRHSDYDAQLSPSATVLYTVAPSHNLRAGYQRAFKSPTVLESHLSIGGVLVGNSTGFEIRDGAGEVQATVDPLSPERVDSLELGYKGVVAGRLFVDAVAYNAWYRDFISPLTQVADPTDPAAPSFAFYPDGTPVAEGSAAEGTLFTYQNFGRAQVRGADLGASFLPRDELEIGASVSLIDLVSFDSAGALRDLLLNVPTVKLKGSVTVTGLGLPDYYLSVSGRWHDAHAFESGYWSSARFGEVGASFTADLAAGYSFRAQGITLGLTVANLLDAAEPDVLGAPLPGRFAYLQVGYALDAFH
jgi:outer membrane receptor for ferrienterochelin and colicins